MGLRLSSWFACAATAVLLGACSPRELETQPDGPPPGPSEIARLQRARIDALSSFALRGHAEVSWRDRTGSHFDDGDFVLMARPPEESSLRISKLGERVLWIGSGEGQWWTIFPRETPSRAILRPWPRASSEQATVGVDGTLAGILAPARLFEALGLSSIDEKDVRTVAWDGARGAWMIELPHRRVFARGESLLPVGVEWENGAGEVIASCELEAFVWPSGDRPAGAPEAEVKPLLATRMRIAAWGPHGSTRERPDAVATLAAEAPSFGAESIKPQLFRWQDVEAALRPEVVERASP